MAEINFAPYRDEYVNELEWCAQRWDHLSDVPEQIRHNLLELRKQEEDFFEEEYTDKELEHIMQDEYDDVWFGENPCDNLAAECGVKDSDFI